MRALVLIAVLLAGGCNGSSDPTSPDGPVPFTQVIKQQHSGINQRRAEVIALEGRWTQVWDEIHSNVSPKPAIPRIDFEKELLILAAYGETGDACREVQIEKVDRKNGALEISILDKQRASNCPVCPPVVAHPVHVVSVARAATGASYSWRVTTVACP